MKKNLLFSLLLVIILQSCNSNKKLLQENADKAIKDFTAENIIGGVRDENYLRFTTQGIEKIDPISQFSETEASVNVTYKYESATKLFQYSFKKNIDNKWVITSITIITNSSWGITTGEEATMRILNSKLSKKVIQ